MKKLIPLSVISTLFLAACGDSTTETVDATKVKADAVASKVAEYSCERGTDVTVRYESSDLAIVNYKGQDFKMEIAVSGSGARYVGDKLEWWSKGAGAGSEGTLFAHNADGTTGDVIESCSQK